MYLFFDTETAGLPVKQYALASDTANWPSIVQIAWVLTDESGSELEAQTFIVRPDGFEISAGATRVHGITTEIARLKGIGIETALDAFAKDVARVTRLVAHNANFDEHVVGATFIRAGRSNPLDGEVIYCTMRTAANAYGGQWPKLTKLHTFLFGTGFESAHDALADARACAKCFFELKRRDVTFGPDETDDQTSEDRDLIDDILSSAPDWWDLSYVYDVQSWFESKGFITDPQRSALENIRDKLEEYT